MVKYDPNKKEEDYTDEELEEFYTKVIKKRLDERIGDRDKKAKEIHAEYERYVVNSLKSIEDTMRTIGKNIRVARMARDFKLEPLLELDPNAKWPWTSMFKVDYRDGGERECKNII